MLNKYIWDLYVKSTGAGIVDMFRRNLSEEMTDEYIEEILRMRKRYCLSDDLNEEIRTQLQDVIQENYLSEDTEERSETCYEDIRVDQLSDFTVVMDQFYEMLCYDDDSPILAMDVFLGGMAFYSTTLSFAYPEFFIPYYFQYNYNILQKIADEFEIELPRIPAKKDYKGRIYFYGEVSRVLLQFAYQNGLSRFELYAFLYDFAPQYIGGTDSYIVDDLPDPRSAFFIGADKNDLFLLENTSGITPWQCSPDTRVGDMIVMYMRSPISAVSSIWRACSVGFVDPFFYYYRCVYISQPVKTKLFTLDMMRKDKMFKSLPIVRKNMQGINGVELYPSVYNHLVTKLKAKTLLLEYEKTEIDDEYSCEKEVENKLIKPIITKLGYDESDYEQQLYIEIGNHNNALIPDFVLLPNKKRGHVSGFAIIEAKRSIPSREKLEEVFIQARSYARVLTAKYCAVASKEKIWITQRKDDYEAVIFEATWEQLNKPDCFYEFDKLIGK